MKATIKILYATKIGQPDYMEQLITEREERIEDASKWAIANGFDRLRVATHIDGELPNFAKTINQ